MQNKKIAVMQPYLFPYIGYFQLINAVDVYILYDDVQWIRGWIISLGIPVILSDIKTNKTVEYRRVHFFHAKNAQDLCQKMQEVVKQNYKPIPVENLIEQSKKNIKKLGNYLIELIEKK